MGRPGDYNPAQPFRNITGGDIAFGTQGNAFSIRIYSDEAGSFIKWDHKRQEWCMIGGPSLVLQSDNGSNQGTVKFVDSDGKTTKAEISLSGSDLVLYDAAGGAITR